MDAYKNSFDLFIQKRQFNFIAPVLVLIFLFITNSALLASTLGVSVGAAAKIAWSAYGAYKAPHPRKCYRAISGMGSFGMVCSRHYYWMGSCPTNFECSFAKFVEFC